MDFHLPMTAYVPGGGTVRFLTEKEAESPGRGCRRYTLLTEHDLLLQRFLRSLQQEVLGFIVC